MRSRSRLAGASVVIGSLLLMAPHADADWRIAGQIGGPVSAIAADSSLMYLGVGFRLHVYDVSDPASPREVGSTNAFGDFVSDIAIAGSRAYVTAGRSGLHIIDTADASNPRTIGRWDSPGSAESVTVVGARAYVADGYSGVSIIDISDPRTPALRSTFFDTYFAFDVAVDGGHAFIAGAGAGLLVADINDPANPRTVAVIDTPGYARAIALSATTLYLADEWGGVRIVSVSDPVRPREIGSIAVQGWALDVTAAKSIIQVAAGSSGFHVYDATDAEHPRLLSSYDVPWNLSWKIAASPTRAFVAMRTQGVAIFDVRNPSALQRLGSVSPLSNAQAVAARGSLAFVATESQGMRIVDFRILLGLVSAAAAAPRILCRRSPRMRVVCTRVKGNRPLRSSASLTLRTRTGRIGWPPRKSSRARAATSRCKGRLCISRTNSASRSGTSPIRPHRR